MSITFSSYLKGSALDCFDPGLLDPIEPAWCSDFNLFIEELEANFSTFDPVREDEAEHEGLCMQENHQAAKYFIKFTQLSSHVYWGKAVLLWQAYNGLAKQIKDEMVHHEKPTTLSRLQKLMQAVNAHYWECNAEIACKTLQTLPVTSLRRMTTSCLQTKAKVLHSPRRRNNNSSSGSSQNKGKSLEPKKMSTPDLSLKLGKDGKLTPQERQHYIDKNLCLFCGAPDHRAANCNKAAVAAKACASKTTPATITCSCESHGW